MKALARNKQTLWYALYTGKTAVYDADGLFTGEYEEGYSTPVEAKMNISPANGRAALEATYSLTLLRIADYGARGLTGPEFAEGDPDALCARPAPPSSA